MIKIKFLLVKNEFTVKRVKSVNIDRKLKDRKRLDRKPSPDRKLKTVNGPDRKLPNNRFFDD